MEIINAKKLEKIPYMDNPPAEGGEIAYLTEEEFKKKFKCEYTEGIVTNSVNTNQKIISERDFIGSRAKAAYQRLQNPLECLVICKMTHDTGCGLFTTEDIPMGTVLCIYSGEYDPNTKEHVYSSDAVNAAEIGGMARFMQHQPASKEGHKDYLMIGLKNYQLFALQENISEEEAKRKLSDTKYVNDKIKRYQSQIKENEFFGGYDFDQYSFKDKALIDQIAQSNIILEEVKMADLKINLMVASRDIKKNESIGFSYGIMYWKHPSIGHPPYLFTKMGQIILPENQYTYTDHSSWGLAKKIAANNPSLSSDPTIFQAFFGNMQVKEKATLAEKINKRKSDLFHITELFLKISGSTWREYPEKNLTGKYIGHKLVFLTMAAQDAEKAKAFAEQLKKEGYAAEFKNTKLSNNPSILVDLTP